MTADESALLIPAPDASSLVDEFRRRYDPSAVAGVPPHITIMGPFLDPSRLTSDLLRDLDHVFAMTEAFEYALTEVREFEQGVLYLAPEPPLPFIHLTDAVTKRFGILPYGGAHSTIVPHLTVSQLAPSDERRRIAAILKDALPQTLTAREAWLMVGHNDRSWRRVHASKFR